MGDFMGKIIYLNYLAQRIDAIMQEIIEDEMHQYFDLATANAVTMLAIKINSREALSSIEIKFINSIYSDLQYLRGAI